MNMLAGEALSIKKILVGTNSGIAFVFFEGDKCLAVSKNFREEEFFLSNGESKYNSTEITTWLKSGSSVIISFPTQNFSLENLKKFLIITCNARIFCVNFFDAVNAENSKPLRNGSSELLSNFENDEEVQKLAKKMIFARPALDSLSEDVMLPSWLCGLYEEYKKSRLLIKRINRAWEKSSTQFSQEEKDVFSWEVMYHGGFLSMLDALRENKPALFEKWLKSFMFEQEIVSNAKKKNCLADFFEDSFRKEKL